MRYISVFHEKDLTIIDIHEGTERLDYQENQFITIEKDEVYRIEHIRYNYDIKYNRTFIYIQVISITDKEKYFLTQLISNSND